MKKNSFFWVGYADLMTGLFFIMLVLFVVSISGFRLKEQGYISKASEADSLKLALQKQLVVLEKNKDDLERNKRVLEEEKKKIEEMQNAIKALPTKYFEYQEQYKRFSLRMQVNFVKGSSIIDTELYKDDLTNVGWALKAALDDLSAKYSDYDIRYLLIIEGMSSSDSYKRNYELSYERALSLYRLWEAQGVEFDPKTCEVQIAGSGTGGIGRYSGAKENLNQRFLIQIIPKIGKI